jgi:hypothetical protein
MKIDSDDILLCYQFFKQFHLWDDSTEIETRGCWVCLIVGYFFSEFLSKAVCEYAVSDTLWPEIHFA